MRILPSVWTFMREPTIDYRIGDFMIEKGSQVFISPYITHRDARWFPEPETFRPERFAPENEKKLPKGAYIRFAAGPRVCLGKAFAQMEAKLILGTMLQRLRPEVSADYELDLLAQLSLRPRNGLPGVIRMA